MAVNKKELKRQARLAAKAEEKRQIEEARKARETERRARQEAELAAVARKKQEAEDARKARETERQARQEAELAAVARKKQEAEDARKAREAERLAAKGQRATKKAEESAARLKARQEARVTKEARKGPRLFDQKLFSLYISDTNLKLLMMKGKYVLKWVDQPLEPGLVTDGLITDPPTMAGKIRALLQEQKIKTKKITAGLSGLHCLSRIITLPVLSGSILAEAVNREAERELPVPLSNVYLAWQIVGVSKSELKIFLIAYTRALADALVETLRQAGIKPHLMDLAPLALIRVINEKTAAIADIRSSELDIIVMVDGIPELIRSLPLPKDIPAAEKLIMVRDEIQRTIKFYNTSGTEKPLEESLPIFVYGESIDEPQLYDSFSRQLEGRVVQTLPPLRYADLPPRRYMVNIGLILKQLYLGRAAGLSKVNLNVLPDIYRTKPPSLAKAVGVPATVAGVAVLALVGMQAQNASAQTELLRKNLEMATQTLAGQQSQQRQLNVAIADVEKQVAEATQTYQTFAGLLTKIRSQQEKLDNDLSLVTSARPAGVVLSNVKYASNVVTVLGKAPGEQEVLKYAEDLGKSGYYSSVNIAALRRNGNPGGMDFTLNLKR